MAYTTYFINLDRAAERADFMHQQFANLGWQAKVERISAIDALQFNGSYPATYTPKKWGAHWQLKPSEIACFESHKKVWTQFLASDAEVAVIFEDDVLIASTLQTKLESLSA